MYSKTSRFIAAKSNADGFDAETTIYPRSASWSVFFPELSVQTVDPGASGLVFLTYQFSTQTTFPLKGWNTEIIAQCPHAIITTSRLHLSSLQSLCIKYTSLIDHADISSLGATLLEHLVNFLSPPISFQHIPYFSHLEVKCWWLSLSLFLF